MPKTTFLYEGENLRIMEDRVLAELQRGNDVRLVPRRDPWGRVINWVNEGDRERAYHQRRGSKYREVPD